MEERTRSGIGDMVTLQRGVGVQPQQDKAGQEVKLQRQRQEGTMPQPCQVGKETHWGTTRRRDRLREKRREE